jgi:phenylacetate-coenzyme A ligase PaaK-like adenylate-forming protein
MLTVEIEPAAGAAELSMLADRVAARLKEALGLSVRVQVVAAGALPRFEMKARRFVVEA